MLEKVFMKSPNVISRVVADEAILVPISGDIADMQHIFALNEVGECIWANIDGKTALSQVVDIVVREFDIEEDVAKPDCLEFVSGLLASQLIIEMS